MALAKTIATQFGVDSTYWNIGAINEDFKNKKLEVVIYGYVSKEARDNNSEPVGWNNLYFNGDDYIQDATRKSVYEKLKTTDFADAVDA
jgi:hypothetical protein